MGNDQKSLNGVPSVLNPCSLHELIDGSLIEKDA